MKNKITTHIYVKEARKDSNGEAPIYLRITINGERAEISTGKEIRPDLWDKASERVAGRSEAARTINASLNTLLGKVEKYYSGLDTKDERISVHQIMDEVRGKGANQMTLVQAYDNHINKMEELIGVDFALNTIKRYKSSLVGLKDFMKNNLSKLDVRLIDLNNQFIEGYHTYLKVTKGLKQNSAAKDIKNLIRVINKAVINKWISKYPFQGFSCNFKDANRGFLNQEEIDKIYSKDLTIKRLDQVRDLFIFQIYTGLSFSDMAELNTDKIEIGINGGRWITLNRKKTGTRSSIPLLPRAEEILEKYKVDAKSVIKGKILPIISNQRMNGYLKELADLCEINKNLTSHIARHTFATTVTLTQGVPIETVSKMLGHSNLRTTGIYAKVVDRKIADDMKALLEKKEEPKVAVAGIS